MPPEAETIVTPPVAPPTSAAGPIQGSEMAAAKPAAVTAPAPVAAAAPKEIYLGGRKFSSLEELGQFTAGLQAKADIADRLTSVVAPQARVVDPMEELGETFFSNPAEAVRKIKDLTKQEVRAEDAQRDAAQALRTKFFNDYPDLRGQEDVVELYYAKMQKELATLSETDATSKLANAARARLASIRGKIEGTQELSNKTPNVLGSGSGAPASGETPYVAKTMSEQLREFQSRGRKTAR
jgi:hypothetical protein